MIDGCTLLCALSLPALALVIVMPVEIQLIYVARL